MAVDAGSYNVYTSGTTARYRWPAATRPFCESTSTEWTLSVSKPSRSLGRGQQAGPLITASWPDEMYLHLATCARACYVRA